MNAGLEGALDQGAIAYLDSSIKQTGTVGAALGIGLLAVGLYVMITAGNRADESNLGLGFIMSIAGMVLVLIVQ